MKKTLFLEVDSEEANKTGDPAKFRFAKLKELIAKEKRFGKHFFHMDTGLQSNGRIVKYKDVLFFPPDLKNLKGFLKNKKLPNLQLICFKSNGRITWRFIK